MTKSTAAIGILVVSLLSVLFASAFVSHRATKIQVANLPQVEHTGEVAVSDHTTLRFYEFTPPKYPGKKCLFIETGAYGSGLTCWDMPR